MTYSNRQTDGERSRSTNVIALAVTGGEDSEDQDEGDEELHSECLLRMDLIVRQGHAQIALVLGRCDALQQGRTKEGSDALRHHKEAGPRHTDLPCDQHGDRDGRVDVSSGDVSCAPHHGTYDESKAQGNLHDGGGIVFLPLDTGTTAHQDQKHGPYHLSHHCSPEQWALYIIYTRGHV